MGYKGEKYGLPKNFFEENPPMDLSAAQFSCIQMITYDFLELNEEIIQAAVSEMEAGRQEAYEQEKQQILQIDRAEDVVRAMRKITEMANRNVVVEKALSMQEEVMPLLLKKLSTSRFDVFIETAAVALANADMEYVEALYDMFYDIRDPYARSEACLVFGVKDRVDYTPLLLEQYWSFMEEYPFEDYEQGPLLALDLIYNK